MRSIDEIEELAKAKLPGYIVNYFVTGTGDEQTLQENRAAYKRLRFMPRIMCADEGQDLATSVLGHKVRIPIGISPTAIPGGTHDRLEVATAEGAERCGAVMIMSSWSQVRLEDVAKSAANCIKWMQMYLNKDRRNTRNLVQRAERMGFKAIVVTVDSPCVGLRKRSGFDDAYRFTKKMKGGSTRGIVNFEGAADDIAKAKASGDPKLYKYVSNQIHSYPKWRDIKWLRTVTKLPLVLKGIMTVIAPVERVREVEAAVAKVLLFGTSRVLLKFENAMEAAASGAKAIIVSNHGGRQLDGVPATIEVLPEIVDALRGSGVEVYVDGGIRNGSDVMKALALGAKFVFVGRPAVWGLALNGADGVAEVLQILENELKVTMALCGCTRLSDIDRSLVVHESRLKCNL